MQELLDHYNYINIAAYEVLMRFLISTANYNSDVHTLNLLNEINTLACSPTNHTFSALVFDNSSSFDIPCSLCFPCEFIKPKRNIGLAATWKMSISHAIKLNYDCLILVNNDVSFVHGFFDEIDSALKNNSAAAYGAFITLENGFPWSTGGEFGFLPWRIKHHANPRSFYGERLYRTEHLSGCCMILPKELITTNFEIFNGLSDFFFRGEEWFVNRRLMEANIDRFILRDAMLIHKENGSHYRFSQAHIYWAIRAKLLYIKKLKSSSRSISLVTYLAYLFTGGLCFYYKNSSMRFDNVVGVVINAAMDGISKRVIRARDYK